MPPPPYNSKLGWNKNRAAEIVVQYNYFCCCCCCLSTTLSFLGEKTQHHSPVSRLLLLQLVQSSPKPFPVRHCVEVGLDFCRTTINYCHSQNIYHHGMVVVVVVVGMCSSKIQSDRMLLWQAHAYLPLSGTTKCICSSWVYEGNE